MTHRAVAKLLDMVDGTEVLYLHVRTRDVDLVISRDYTEGAEDGGGGGGTSALVVASAEPTSGVGAKESRGDRDGVLEPEDGAARAEPLQGAVGGSESDRHPNAQDDGSLEVVRSPLAGIFYSAPAPDAPTFVELGSIIEAGATVGLVETMKVFTAVTAEVGGKVAERYVANEEIVEAGQPLFGLGPPE